MRLKYGEIIGLVCLEKNIDTTRNYHFSTGLIKASEQLVLLMRRGIVDINKLIRLSDKHIRLNKKLLKE